MAVVSRGIECPLIREGDNIVDIVVNSVLSSVNITPYGRDINDKDIIGITESVVARAAGQYISVDDIKNDIIDKFGNDATIYIVNPIYSRNRFGTILRGIARGCKKVVIMMPDVDEVGNPAGVNPFTGVNIQEYYKEICESENCECQINYLDGTLETNTIYCGLHDYNNWKDLYGDTMHYTLADICSNKSPDWGVLGTNKMNEETLKLFPSKKECLRVCEGVKSRIKEEVGKDVIVCVYGDGCFKDAVGGIWEFADPVSMPGYTDANIIMSTPCELKLKSMIDSYDECIVNNMIKANSMLPMIEGQTGDMGTTPRLYRDLLASLMDLTSGSGDKGTPVILIQHYFDKFHC